LSTPEPIKWKNGSLYLLDQRKIPFEISYVKCVNYIDVAEAIEDMIVRGAPAIGIAAGYGVVLAAEGGICGVQSAIERLSKTRPTAVNLFWALKKMEEATASFLKATDCKYSSSESVEAKLKDYLLETANKIHQEEIQIENLIAFYGQRLLPERCNVLTHCNAGSLATGAVGTALGIIKMGKAMGKDVRVYCDETRPLLQGARLSAWELWMEGLDVTVICDNMAAFLMKKGGVDLVIVGADRIASNGDTANKIGTYNLALLCRHHGIPFYVAAPRSTIDMDLVDGEAIPIEERRPEEVRSFGGAKIFLDDISVWNPAFDITPNDMFSGIVTEVGILEKPYKRSILEAASKSLCLEEIKKSEESIGKWRKGR